MVSPVIPTSFLQELKAIDPGLMVVWHESLERFQIIHKDVRNGTIRLICTVEDQDGNFMPCDGRILDFLQTQVNWEWMGRFPEGKEMWAHASWLKSLREKSMADDLEYSRKRLYRDNRKAWREAYENFQRGIISRPAEREKKIIVNYQIPEQAKNTTLFDAKGRAIQPN